MTIFLSLRKTHQALKTIGCLILLIGSSALSFAQIAGKGKLSGKVIDSATNSPVAYASVSIYKTGDPRPFNGGMTDRKGDFILAGLPAGTFRLVIDFVGYAAKIIPLINISGNSPAVSLGTVSLRPLQQQLQAVTVTGKAQVVENKIDKLVYNTAIDIASQGGVALDVLRKVPMVSVDVDGNVELLGDANVRFLINGKPSGIFGASLADALQSIPASQIRSIEVITTPGARYGAQGTAGIINIILKESKLQGINGNVNLSIGTRLENGSFNIDARKGNIGLNAFFSGNDQMHSTTINNYNRKSFSITADTVTSLYEKGASPFTRNGYQSGFSLEWSVTPKDELTATIGYDHTQNHGTSNISQNQYSATSAGAVFPDIVSVRNSASSFYENPMDWSLAYKKTLKREGQELDILYTSSYEKSNIYASQVSGYPNGDYPPSGLNSSNPGSDHETDISIDYSQPIAKGFAIQTGAKAVLENIHNLVIADTLLSNGDYAPDADQTYGFHFVRTIYAGYLSATFSLFKDFLSGEAGMRYEHTVTNSDFSGTDIPAGHLWAPSLLLQHKLNESQFVKFAYSYRIERPDYDDLNPFVNISDPHNITTGNPLLKNEIGHKYELGFSSSLKSGGNIYLGGYYNYNKNDIQQIFTYYPVYSLNAVDYYDVTLAQRENIGSQTTYGANISGSVPIAGKLNLRSNMLLREIINTMPGLASVSGFTYKVSLNASYQLSRDMVAEVFGNYTSRRTVFQSVRPALLFYTMAVKKQSRDKKVSYGFSVTNLFNRYVNQLTTAYGPNFNQSNLRQIPLRSFGVTLSYKFGKQEAKNKDKEEDNSPVVPSL